MKTLKYFMFLLFFLVLIFNTNKKTFSAENKYDIIDFEKVIQSGKGSVTFEWGIVDSKGNFTKEVLTSKDKKGVDVKYLVNETTFAFSGNKFRIYDKELLPLPGKDGERTYPVVTEKAFDGKLIKVINYIRSSSNAMKPSSGYIDKPELSFDNFDPRRYFCIGNVIFSDFINDLKNKNGSYQLKNISKETIDNCRCIVFEAANIKEGKFCKISIPENHLYIPKQIEMTDKKGNWTYITAFSLKEYTKGVLFPEKIIHLANNKKMFIKEIVTFGDDFKINIEIPDQTFSLNFPNNIKLTDNRFGNKQ